MLIIDIIAGARPNFVKIAPLLRAFRRNKEYDKLFKCRIVHTGQHYDSKMSDSFFQQLNIPEPDINLNCGGGGGFEVLVGKIMIEYNKVLSMKCCDLCIVVGDVTSTLACSLIAKKYNVKLAHIEAGLRSNDLSMPEEINRILTDSISDIFFTTSFEAAANLVRLGTNHENIHFVGNLMIDSLVENFDKKFEPEIWKKNSLLSKDFFVLTLHRPSNVDNICHLTELLEMIGKHSRNKPIIFPSHPRIFSLLNEKKIIIPKNIVISPPMTYLEFIFLLNESRAIITDSGGITEEATYLNIPCLTLRENTERPETVSVGSNVLVGNDEEKFAKYLNDIFEGNWKSSTVPEKWDGNTAERISFKILQYLNLK
jgi:UDP-N-acetylglucosamine 2-epimerase (non-hydrolysing)